MYVIILSQSEYKVIQKYKFYGYTKKNIKWKLSRLRIRYLIFKDVYAKTI